jgi:hypothetical protein
MEKKYQIYERKNPSGNIGYRIHIGGKKFRQFRTKRDALLFIAELKEVDQQKDKSQRRILENSSETNMSSSLVRKN